MAHPAPAPVARLRLVVSERCNLRCAYCHAAGARRAGRLMQAETAVASLRAFVARARASGAASAEVSLYGGEPLLNVPTVSAVLSEARTIGDAGWPVAVVVNTNGTRVDPGAAALLAAGGARVTLSVDGAHERANVHRALPSGASTLAAALAGWDLLRRAGCRVQVNSVVTEASLPGLDALVRLASERGATSVFAAIPDGFACGAPAARRLATPLLDARAWAARLGLDLTGPWDVGARPPAHGAGPPLNLVATPDGRCRFLYAPRREFSTVAEALDARGSSGLTRDWRALRAPCRSCELTPSCGGYLRAMVWQHTGSCSGAPMQCELARAVARLRGRSPRFRELRTSVDARVRRVGRSYTAWNAAAPAARLTVSRDVIDLLQWFAPGGSRAALARTLRGEGVDDVVSALERARLLVEPGRDTDVLDLLRLSGGTVRDGPAGTLLGARTARDLDRLEALAPVIEGAWSRLPDRLRASARPCLFGAADAEAFARAAGATGRGELPRWMIGTVARSTIILDLERCGAAARHGGQARIEELTRGLTHELAHVALRSAGVRTPPWLEEGLCEELAGAPLGDEVLRRAAVHAGRFVRFALAAAGGNPGPADASLLALSSAPVDENPAYALSHDLVRWLSRPAGLEPLLDALLRAGFGALVGAVPLEGHPSIRLRRSWPTLLAAWRRDLDRRARVPRPFRRALRVVVEPGGALIYDRVFGGARLVSDEAARLAPLAGRNLTEGEVARALGPGGRGVLAGLGRGGFAPRAGLHLRLVVAGRCNLRCAYCYADRAGGLMDPATADRAVAAWRDRLRARDLGRSTIRFFGGEPLLAWRTIEHVLDAAAVGLDRGAVRFALNTNGTLLRDRHVARLRREGELLTVLLSCDGVGATHDRARQRPGGRPTFREVEAAARRLADAGVPLCLAATVGDHNVAGLQELAGWAIALRARYRSSVSLALEPTIGPARRASPRWIRSISDALDACAAAELPVGGKWLRPFEALLDPAAVTGHFCGATGTETSIAPDGRPIACPALPADAAGELPGREAGAIDGCSGCEVEGLCAGGCAAQALRARGRVRSRPDDAYCTTTRAIFRHLCARLVGGRAGALARRSAARA